MIDAAIITAIFGGIALLLTSVGSLLLSWKAANKATEAAEKTDVVKAQVDVVKVQVDGNLSRVTSALAVEQETNKGHVATIAALKSAASAAQDVAMKPAEPPRNEPPPADTKPPSQ